MAETETAEEALARNAARAAKLALFCLAVSILVLAIDHRLKNNIIHEAKRCLALLDEARKLAEEARQGGPLWASKQDGTAASPAVDGADGVVHAPRASAKVAADARRGTRKAPGGEAGEG